MLAPKSGTIAARRNAKGDHRSPSMSKSSKKSAPKAAKANKPNTKRAHPAPADHADSILDPQAATDATTNAEATASAAGTIQPAEGFTAGEFPVDEIKLNTLRMPSEEAVDEMAKSISKIGLQNPVIVDAEKNLISGNTRVLAYRKLGRKTIPGRFAVDAKGNAISAAEAAATIAGLAENLVRTNMTPVELGKAALEAIRLGHAGSEKELANRIGVSAAVLNKSVSIANKAAGPVSDAIASGELSLDAGVAIVQRCAEHDAQNAALELVRKAVKGKLGKITAEDVEKVVPQKERKERTGKSRAGRPVEKAPLPAEATNAAESGIRAMLRKTENGMIIELDVEIVVNSQTFARYDLEAAIQKAAAKLDKAMVNKELEVARQRLDA